jgi:hypothetical protein
MTIAELLQAILGGQSNILSADFEEWVKTSRRFHAFAETYQDKIRRKCRLANDEEALKSLYSELETAYRLLADSRFTIEYEKYAASKKRGADFTLAFRVNLLCNLEVTRLRFMPGAVDVRMEWKVTEAVLDKVGQMSMNAINILYILSDQPVAADDLPAALAALRLRAERKDEEFFVKRGFHGGADFLKQFRQLSAVFCRSDGVLHIWNNAIAKHSVPRELENALKKSLMPF